MRRRACIVCAYAPAVHVRLYGVLCVQPAPPACLLVIPSRVERSTLAVTCRPERAMTATTNIDYTIERARRRVISESDPPTLAWPVRGIVNPFFFKAEVFPEEAFPDE